MGVSEIMYLSSLVGMISDSKLYIELVEHYSRASFGFYTKDTIRASEFWKNDSDYKIVEINSQYFNGKRVLVLHFVK